MSAIARCSSRQLALLASRPLRPAARLSLRAVRSPRTLRPAAVQAAYFSHQTRLWSPDSPGPKTPENPDPKKPTDSNDGPKPANPPPPPPPRLARPSWVFLNEAEVNSLVSYIRSRPASTHETGFQILEFMKKNGAPRDVVPLVRKHLAGQAGFLDGVLALKLGVELAWVMQDLDEPPPNRTFTSNQPPNDDKTPSNEKQSTGKNVGDQEQQKPQQEQDQQQQQTNAQQGEPQQQQNQNQGSGGGGGPKRPGFNMGELTTNVIGLIVAWYILDWFTGTPYTEITWQELRANYLEKGLVEKFTVEGNNRVRVDLNAAAGNVQGQNGGQGPRGRVLYITIGSADSFERKVEEAQSQLGIPPSERIPIRYSTPGSSTLGNLILAFGPTLMLVGLLMWVSRGRSGGGGGIGGAFRFGKSRAKKFNHESAVKVKFSDVAGMDEAKLEIVEFVSFLRTPEKFVRLGAKIPRGAILSGPPGTGKTLLAKATAGESGVPFFSVSGSEFVEMFVGVGASRVRDLFEEARKSAPCIIFIDEIDAIGKARDSGRGFSGGNDEREATLNQILTEMDGFNTNEQVVVLAGTNRPDILDKALMRPGRFDRHIHIDRPTMKGRSDIFKVHLKKIHTNEDMEYLCGRLSALTPGFAGADIANVVNEAALVAARAEAESVLMEHFERAIERVIGGLERKSLVLSPVEKRTVAYHEAGHAICGWYFQWADPLLKVSIIPRGQGALGYAQYLPAGDAYLMNTNQLMDRMAMTLGGRISEELHFPTVTTGASDDFKKVTQMATTMVTKWGMSDKVGPVHYEQDQNQVQKPFAESTAQTIDAEVRRIVDQAYKQCKDLLTEKIKEVGIVAEELLRKEVLDRDDMVRLLGKRPFPDREEFTKYFNNERPPLRAGPDSDIAPPPFPAEGPPPADAPPPTPTAFEDGNSSKPPTDDKAGPS